MQRWILASCVFAISCASYRVVMAPDGKPAMYVKCGRDEARCLDAAQEACPAGYDVLSTDQGDVAAVKVSESSKGYKAKVKPSSGGFIMIRCH